MKLREIVSNECFLGWPGFFIYGANRQVAYLFLDPDEQVTAEETEEGETVITSADNRRGWKFSPGLEPVIIRRVR